MIQAGVALLLLLSGAGLFVYLLSTREAVEETAPRSRAVPVETLEVQAENLRPPVRAKGILEPARALTLAPEVSGRLVELHPALAAGGLIAKEAVVARVDPRDYRLAVVEAEARLNEARARLKLERGRQEVAEDELDYYREQDDPEVRAREDLILRGPQEAIAESAVQRAEAALARARLNLERTEVRAPFACVVERESVEIGQIVQPGTPIAEIQGTERGWVEARVPLRLLPLLIGEDGLSADPAPGLQASVRLDAGGVAIERPARVLRWAKSLDPGGRMARLILEVEDPFLLEAGNAGAESAPIPLLYDSFVAIEVRAAKPREVFVIPASCLRNRDRIYVFNNASQLEIREAEVLLRDEDTVYLTGGLHSGDQVVTSLISTPVEGMDLRQTGSTSGASGKREGRG